MLDRRLGCAALLCLLLAFFPAPGTRAARPAPTVLYDGARGTLPQVQGWAFLFASGTPAQAHDAGAALLDTSAAKGIQAGYFASQAGFFGSTAPVPALDRTAGFTVTFTLELQSEKHNSPNRAGFSIIVLGSDAQGIELSFWQDRIWAQEGGTDKLFTQAEGVDFDTAATLARYDLVLAGDAYQLRNGGRLLLAGPARDYHAFGGQPDPYETPNFLFLGDDTQSASARFRLGQVAVALPPDPPPPRVLFLPLAQ